MRTNVKSAPHIGFRVPWKDDFRFRALVEQKNSTLTEELVRVLKMWLALYKGDRVMASHACRIARRGKRSAASRLEQEYDICQETMSRFGFRVSLELGNEFRALATAKGNTLTDELTHAMQLWLHLHEGSHKTAIWACQVARANSRSTAVQQTTIRRCANTMPATAGISCFQKENLKIKEGGFRAREAPAPSFPKEIESNVAASPLSVSDFEQAKDESLGVEHASQTPPPSAKAEQNELSNVAASPLSISDFEQSEDESLGVRHASQTPPPSATAEQSELSNVAASPLSASDFEQAKDGSLGVGHASQSPSFSASPSGCSSSWRSTWKRKRKRDRCAMRKEAFEVLERGPEALGYLGRHREMCANLSDAEQIAVEVLARVLALQEAKPWIRRLSGVSDRLWENLVIAAEEMPELELWERGLDYWAAHEESDVPIEEWHVNSLWRLLDTPDSDVTGPRFIARYAARKYHDLCSGSPRVVTEFVNALKDTPEEAQESGPNAIRKLWAQAPIRFKHELGKEKGVDEPHSHGRREPMRQNTGAQTSTKPERQTNGRRKQRCSAAPPDPEFLDELRERQRRRLARIDQDPEALRRIIRMFEQSAQLKQTEENRAQILAHIEEKRALLATLVAHSGTDG